MEKLWNILDKKTGLNKNTQIFNLLYLRGDFTKIDEIKHAFDTWTIKDLEEALEHLHMHPTMEDSFDNDGLALGQDEIYFKSDFYEAADLRDGVFTIWKNTAPLSRKPFF